MFFRENTEGEYVLGSRGVELPGMAVDFKVTTDPGTRRIARAAFDYARQQRQDPRGGRHQGQHHEKDRRQVHRHLP